MFKLSVLRDIDFQTLLCHRTSFRIHIGLGCLQQEAENSIFAPYQLAYLQTSDSSKSIKKLFTYLYTSAKMLTV